LCIPQWRLQLNRRESFSIEVLSSSPSKRTSLLPFRGGARISFQRERNPPFFRFPSTFPLLSSPSRPAIFTGLPFFFLRKLKLFQSLPQVQGKQVPLYRHQGNLPLLFFHVRASLSAPPPFNSPPVEFGAYAEGCPSFLTSARVRRGYAFFFSDGSLCRSGRAFLFSIPSKISLFRAPPSLFSCYA